MDEHETMAEPTTSTSPTPPVRRRAGRKRASFRRLPTPAPSVRGLWLAASDEERSKAHRLCMAILEYWLGRASKQAVAERLETSPLRVWQLSQQALSGMLVGLLRLPKSRAKLERGSAPQATDSSTLRQRIAELEKKLARTEDLVRVLKHLPWEGESADGRPPSGRGRSPRRRRSPKAQKPRATPGGRSVAGPTTTEG